MFAIVIESAPTNPQAQNEPKNFLFSGYLHQRVLHSGPIHLALKVDVVAGVVP